MFETFGVIPYAFPEPPPALNFLLFPVLLEVLTHSLVSLHSGS